MLRACQPHPAVTVHSAWSRHGLPTSRNKSVFKLRATVPNTLEASAKIKADNIVKLVRNSNRGLSLVQEAKNQVLSAVNELYKESKGITTTTSFQLSATWKLLYTTEKETLFLLQNAGLFGTQAGEVYQVIDVDTSSLQNVVTFPPDGAFIVTSSIAVASPQRVEFKFEAAKLKLPSTSLPIPPYGQGWFDNVYVDDDIRIAKDIRGDVLVVERDGPPRVFE